METTLHVYTDTDQIQQNTPERNWVQNIYNDTILQTIGHLPGFCSGTTLGGQPAMETYNRAMIHEWDITSHANNIGMDQGRHIVLVRMKKLVGAPNISHVEIFKMGTGEVNTLGVPLKHLRIPLEEWKGYDSTTTETILNEDGSPSHCGAHV